MYELESLTDELKVISLDGGIHHECSADFESAARAIRDVLKESHKLQLRDRCTLVTEKLQEKLTEAAHSGAETVEITLDELALITEAMLTKSR